MSLGECIGLHSKTVTDHSNLVTILSQNSYSWIQFGYTSFQNSYNSSQFSYIKLHKVLKINTL